MTTFTPNIVRLTFDPNEDEQGSWYSVVVRDQDGMLVCAGPMSVINKWLRENGYKYVASTNAVWRRDI